MEREPMEAMEKKVTLSWLLAFYGELLTDNQQQMARLHWEEDYTLSEIAQQFSVSRQSVHDTLNRTEKQLDGWEEKLGLLKKFRQMETGLQAIQHEMNQVVATRDTQSHLQSALRMVAALLDQEEQ